MIDRRAARRIRTVSLVERGRPDYFRVLLPQTEACSANCCCACLYLQRYSPLDRPSAMTITLPLADRGSTCCRLALAKADHVSRFRLCQRLVDTQIDVARSNHLHDSKQCSSPSDICKPASDSQLHSPFASACNPLTSSLRQLLCRWPFHSACGVSSSSRTAPIPIKSGRLMVDVILVWYRSKGLRSPLYLASLATHFDLLWIQNT
jgi:hypothetical protein